MQQDDNALISLSSVLEAIANSPGSAAVHILTYAGINPSGGITRALGSDQLKESHKISIHDMIALASKQSIRLGHSYIGTEHVLLALATTRFGEGVLRQLGRDVNVLDRATFQLLIDGPSPSRAAPFGWDKVRSGSAIEQALNEFLYKANFRTHNEVLRAGIGLGVPAYGVPIRIGEVFTTQQREEWRAERKYYDTPSSTACKLYQRMIELADQQLLADWQEYLNSSEGPCFGLRGRILDATPNQCVVALSWKPLPEDKQGATILNVEVAGVSRVDFAGGQYEGQGCIPSDGGEIRFSLNRGPREHAIIYVSTDCGDIALAEPAL